MSRLPVVIIGAGAAGLMAAISSARAGAATQLLDRRRKVGAKILMSGGTRCNVTNQAVSERDFNASSSPFVRNVLKQFSPEQARAFFAEVGVELKLEPTGKYFPVSDSATDVLAGLLRSVDAERVELHRESLVTGVERYETGLVVRTSTGSFPAAAVVIATGGLSYPETGSDGIGYRIAAQLGHSIVRTSAALTPLIASPALHASLSGLSVNAELRVVSRTKT
ncbi:MAG: aminoacetone oxidase family FAD-binding enzyme [Blastocatellia bacterium]|nr:aminoacetone oxidase family FAD-binding enzyme [Blastocatellia bacterium]